MANNRELSQLGSFISVDDTSRNIGIATTATPYVGIGTTNPQYKLDVYGDINFTQDLYKNGQLFVAGVGVGSNRTNPQSGIVTNRIGVGFTDINIVGTGISVTGYGSTIVIDFGNIAAASGGALSISTVFSPRIQDIAFVGGQVLQSLEFLHRLIDLFMILKLVLWELEAHHQHINWM